MPNIRDVLDVELLTDMLGEGYVRRGDHPTLPLSIYNYTSKAQYDQEWNDVTEQCRGLIVDHAGEIVARPFRKFFNLGQLADHQIPQGRFTTYEKMDGSLGVLYPSADSWAIATRGSFSSDQAIHATAVLHARYSEFQPEPDCTYLFEIIYPKNRIVVNYGDLDDLVLLDVIDINTGMSRWADAATVWPGPVRGVHDAPSIEHLLALPSVSNAEGFVLHFDNDMRVKVKHDEYTRLHRVLTNITARRLYEIAARDDLRGKGYTPREVAYAIGVSEDDVDLIPSFNDILERVPDEFYAWVQATRADLEAAYQKLDGASAEAYVRAADYAHRKTFAGVDGFVYRKYFAEAAKTTGCSDILFFRVEGRDVSGIIWKRIRPAHQKPFFNQTEDVA